MTYKELIKQLMDLDDLDAEVAIKIPTKDNDALYDTINDVRFDFETNALVIDKDSNDLVDILILATGCNDNKDDCTITPDTKFNETEKELSEQGDSIHIQSIIG